MAVLNVSGAAKSRRRSAARQDAGAGRVTGMMRHRPDAIAVHASIGTKLVQSCNTRV